ncbi:MAG: DUF4038 domain-containing protein [Opitutaceae bacterium]
MLTLLTLTASMAIAAPGEPTRRWEPFDIQFQAAEEHPWWEFPVRAEFTHEGSGEKLSVEGCWDGERRWLLRFTAPRAGIWSYRTTSKDRGLDDRSGRIEVRAPTATEIDRNPNLRGSVRVAGGGRHFEYADGTPFFLLADTAWAANTARCGLGEREDGPFFQYLADRRAKGFNAILMQYFHGYGDYPDSPGHRNEGGYTYFERDPARLNPAHFAALDRRMRGLWARGFVAAINATWWGKTRRCLFSPEDARRVSAYCAVRYGAFNALWSTAGEYQYVFKDCGWTEADVHSLGQTVQAHNPWRRPVSIHPSARLDWAPPHNVQSSRPFHGASWLDHHWLQTGQSDDRLFNIVTRLRDDRALEPRMPLFLSEALYESALDPDAAYHIRWQVWASFLNGAAGYGYGAEGIYQFYDPADPKGEKGMEQRKPEHWRQALQFPGSTQLAPAKKLLTSLHWWKLEPRRDTLRVNGKANPLPTAEDLSSPHCAVIPDSVAIAYLPRGNADREIALAIPFAAAGTARWFDPRVGQFVGESLNPLSAPAWILPARPAPADDDWVLVVSRR